MLAAAQGLVALGLGTGDVSGVHMPTIWLEWFDGRKRCELVHEILTVVRAWKKNDQRSKIRILLGEVENINQLAAGCGGDSVGRSRLGE